MGQGIKSLNRDVVSTFENLKKNLLLKAKGNPLRQENHCLRKLEMNNKTQEVSEAFCVNCHNYKEEIDKLLKQKTEEQISRVY